MKRRVLKIKKARTAAVLIALAAVIISAALSKKAEPLFFTAKKADDPAGIAVYSERTVSVLSGGEISDMPLEEYLIGVVAAEMPVGYEPEALKAQAVAARTYTVRKAARGGCGRKEGADICTDSGHCQAYADIDRLKSRWAEDFEKNYEKVRSAVESTAGQIIVYNGEAIEALFCASAGGMTENSENVYSDARAYLKSVESPDKEGYVFYKDFTGAEFSKLMKNKFGVTLSKSDPLKKVNILSRYDSGRVKSVEVGGKTVSGTQIRSALSLSSTNFTFTKNGSGVTVTTVGYGHGIGLSQAGSNELAKQGMDYIGILKHYYQGVEIVDA